MLPPPAHDSGPGWVAGPFLYGSFIRYSIPVYPGAFSDPELARPPLDRGGGSMSHVRTLEYLVSAGKRVARIRTPWREISNHCIMGGFDESPLGETV